MAETYKVYRDSEVVAENLTEKSYADSGLTPVTLYKYQVSKVNSVGESPKTPELSVTTLATVPGAPALAVTAGDGKVNYTITPPEDNGGDAVDSYDIKYKTQAGAENWTTENVTALTGSITGLTNGTAYQFKAAAKNSAGSSIDSTVVFATPEAPVVAVTGITLDKTTDSIAVGANDTLVAAIEPENATDKDIVWTSSDETKATVDSTGKVTGVAEGTATITAKAHGDQTKTATCEVTITAA